MISPSKIYAAPGQEAGGPVLDSQVRRGRLIAFGIVGSVGGMVASPIILGDVIGPRFAMRAAVWAAFLYFFIQGKNWARWGLLIALMVFGCWALIAETNSLVYQVMAGGMICLAVIVLGSKDLRRYLAHVKIAR